MTTPPADTDARPTGEGALPEWLLRASAAAIVLFGVTRVGGVFCLDPTRYTVLLLLITELYTLALVVLARRARQRDVSPLAVATTAYAAFFWVLLNPTNVTSLVPEGVGVAIQGLGMTGQLAAKVWLGRSFGLLPAHREAVLRGPYRFVRHPMYLAYTVGNLGFLLVNASWHNLAVFAVLLQVQLYRIHREEIVLAHAPEYREYTQRVRWRLLPFVY